MGRDWSWISCKSTKTPSSSAATTTSKRTRDATSGCINTVFHLFDFHHFQFPSYHRSSSSNSITSQIEEQKNSSNLKEVEASRNSLESTKDEKLNFPKIKTRPKSDSSSDFSSDISSSPATKTPTLVARLMGLDLLPDPPSASSTPKSLHLHSQPKKHLQIKQRNSLDSKIGTTRSLPETPRFSAARRSDGDLHLHHRRDFPELKINDEIQNSSNMKKLKLNVGRKVGMDITNTVRNRQELVSQFKAKKISKAVPLSKITEETTSENRNSIQSRSPRLKFLEPRTNNAATIQKPATLSPPEIPIRPNKKCRKSAGEKFSHRIRKPVQEEAFIRHSIAKIQEKKFKKTPLSKNLSISVPTLFPVKKDPSFNSSPSPKSSKKQITEAQRSKQSSELFRSLSQLCKNQEQTRHVRSNKGDDRFNRTTSATNGGEAEQEIEYITKVLSRIGIDENTPVRISLSRSQSLDPSIFYYLENFTPADGENSKLRHRCNRKLLFYLVDEILSEILKPKPIFRQLRGSELIEKLSSKIRSFPGADCQDLDDIDALIGGDLSEEKVKVAAGYEEEGEGIAAEIERWILDEIVNETAEEICETVAFNGETVSRRARG